MRHAGLLSLGAFIPGEPLKPELMEKTVGFLANRTQFPREYIDTMISTGNLPGRMETNEDGWSSQPWFNAWLEQMPEKHRENPFQGTTERRRVPMDPTSLRESIHPHPMIPSDAETLAGALAIVRSSLHPDDIDLVLAHSHIPDRPVPTNVSLIQHKLNLPNAGAYGIDTCCSSFVTMIEAAETYVRAGVKDKVLIVSSYIDSHINDKSDYHSVMVGDCALAGIVGLVEEGYGYQASHSTSHGSRHDGIVVERRRPGLLRYIGTSPTYEQEFATFLNYDACREIGKNAVPDLREVVMSTLKKAGKAIPDVNLFVTHQPVSWAPHVWREALEVLPERFYESFSKYGNVATCAAGLNLYESLTLGKLTEGELALIASPGAGENHIAVLERVSKELIENTQ